MNARSYRVDLRLSPLDFPAIKGIGESSVFYQSEPHLNNTKVVLEITKTYVFNKHHPVLTAKSVYEIPLNEIQSREDVYEFYKDATVGLNEAYQFAQSQIPGLPSIIFPFQPIENYKAEIDRVFNLLNNRN